MIEKIIAVVAFLFIVLSEEIGMLIYEKRKNKRP